MSIIKEMPAVPPRLMNAYQDDEPRTKAIHVRASYIPDRSANPTQDPMFKLSYQDCAPFAHGSFGIVMKAKESKTGETIAIKKILKDNRYKIRELEITRAIDHPNLMGLKYYFYTYGKQANEVYLGLVFDYLPETVHALTTAHKARHTTIPKLDLKAYAYQIFRGLAYLHSYGICHRDIKPTNVLLNSTTRMLKICDFGSAKHLESGHTSVAYICSRFYRAPELLLGYRKYNCKVDIWSTGCTIAEMIILDPLFLGGNWLDQLAEIIRVLGIPTREVLKSFDHDKFTFDFRFSIPMLWKDALYNMGTNDEVELLTDIMKYSLDERPSAVECMAMRFFDDLRIKGRAFGDKQHFPRFFNFSAQEISAQGSLTNSINPPWNRIVKNSTEQPRAHHSKAKPETQATAGTSKRHGHPSQSHR